MSGDNGKVGGVPGLVRGGAERKTRAAAQGPWGRLALLAIVALRCILRLICSCGFTCVFMGFVGFV